nr:unnamed protein product [Spirometra erinaceieuropaei]
MMSGIRDRELAMIFTNRPPANVKEALDLDAARRTQYPLAKESHATRGQLRAVAHSTFKFPGPPNNTHCYYCNRFGTVAKKCGHNSGNHPLPLATLYTLSPDFKPLTISGTVANKTLSILIDTGAAVSLIHISLIHGPNYNQPGFPQLQILTANNSILQLSGSATVPVLIKDKTIRHRFLVSSELKWNVILDFDFLKQHAQAITSSPLLRP